MLKTYTFESKLISPRPFLRNVGYAHRNQHVAIGRFTSEEQLMTWLLEPFPWLVLGVYRLEQAHPQWKDELVRLL